MPRQRLSATLEFGGKVLGSLSRSTSIVSRSLSRTGKVSGKLEARQRGLRREIKRLSRSGQDVTHLRRRYDELGRTLQVVERRQRGLVLAQRLGGRAGQSFNRLGTIGLTGIAVGATAAGAGVFALAKRTADLGDKVAKTSAKLGVLPQTLLELRFAAERSGVEVKGFDTALQRMVRRISTARAKPNGPLAKALSQVGIEVSTLASMRPEEQLEVIADAMKGLESQADRVRLAFTLFDTEGVGLVNLLQGGSKGIQDLRGEFKALGVDLGAQDFVAAEVFQDRLLDAKTALKGFGLGVGASLLTPLSNGLAKFTEMIRSSQFDAAGFGERVGASMSRVFDALAKNGPQLVDLGIRMTDGLVASIPVLVEIGEKFLGLVDAIGGPEVAIKGLGALIGASLGLRVFSGVIGGAKALRDLGTAASAIPIGRVGRSIGRMVPLVLKFGAAAISVVGKLGGVLKWGITIVRALGLAMLSTPLGWIAAAITGAILLVTHWDVVKKWFLAFTDWLGRVAPTVWENFRLGAQVMVDFVLGKLRGLRDAVLDVLGYLGKLVGFGDDDVKVPVPTTATTRLKAATQGVTTTTQTKVEHHQAVKIDVHPTPGMDEKSLARRVVRGLQRETRSAQTGALYG